MEFAPQMATLVVFRSVNLATKPVIAEMDLSVIRLAKHVWSLFLLVMGIKNVQGDGVVKILPNNVLLVKH
jgi:hypothetical protein